MVRWFVALIVCLLFVSSARAQLPQGLVFDDGFTWIECKNFETTEDNVAVGRWVPEMNLRILGQVPARSGWKVVVKKDGKSLAEYLNDGFPVSLARGPAIGMNIVGWWKATPKLQAEGLLDFEVYYIDGKSDKEYLAKTLKVDVRRADRVRGGPGSREAGAPSYYVNRHGEVLSTLLYFREVEFPSYTQMNGLTYYSDRVVELILNYSENQDFAGPTLGRLRVEVDGKEIEMTVPNNTVIQDEMGYGEQAGKYNVEYSDRAADKYFQGGTAYKERIGFSRRVMVLPLQWGPKPDRRPPSKVFTNDHPGEWKVTYIINRKPVRVWRFKIDRNGLPVPHAEQTKGGLNLLPNAVLVDTEIPGEGGDFDGRLTPEFVTQGGFFGRPWASDSLKTLSAKVPSKGTPFPVASDKQ
jgi:hypothetical protein